LTGSAQPRTDKKEQTILRAATISILLELVSHSMVELTATSSFVTGSNLWSTVGSLASDSLDYAKVIDRSGLAARISLSHLAERTFQATMSHVQTYKLAAAPMLY
jgi:hypothetical protein